MQKINRSLLKCAALGVVLISASGCVLEPAPPPPPVAYAPAPVVAAPGAYYGVAPQPCCYSYPEYPPYYGYSGVPAVGVGVVVGGGGRHWR